jgi:ABC-type polysaccharide/polyol phosphate export permease
MNNSLRLVAIAVFSVLAFAVTGLTSWSFLSESSVIAQNDTVVNETMLYTNQTEMAPETKR